MRPGEDAGPVATVTLRPLGSVMPIGMAGLAVASLLSAGAGVVSLVVVAIAGYVAWALALEGVVNATLIPTLRRGAGPEPLSGSLVEQTRQVTHELGVRQQL